MGRKYAKTKSNRRARMYSHIKSSSVLNGLSDNIKLAGADATTDKKKIFIPVQEESSTLPSKPLDCETLEEHVVRTMGRFTAVVRYLKWCDKYAWQPFVRKNGKCIDAGQTYFCPHDIDKLNLDTKTLAVKLAAKLLNKTVLNKDAIK